MGKAHLLIASRDLEDGGLGELRDARGGLAVEAEVLVRLSEAAHTIDSQGFEKISLRDSQE